MVANQGNSCRDDVLSPVGNLQCVEVSDPRRQEIVEHVIGGVEARRLGLPTREGRTALAQLSCKIEVMGPRFPAFHIGDDLYFDFNSLERLKSKLPHGGAVPYFIRGRSKLMQFVA